MKKKLEKFFDSPLGAISPLIVGALLVGGLMVGCGAESTEPEDPSVSTSDTKEIHPRLVDGRTVTCLQDTYYKRGGLSCDWANAK